MEETKQKRVKSWGNFVVGCVTAVASVALVAIYFLLERDIRLLAAAFITAVWAVGDLYDAFHKRPIEERLAEQADERDVFLAMKSSRTAMNVFNKTLVFASVVLFWVYAKFDVLFLLPVAVTLCGVELFLFVLLLCVNLYYEKRG